jgi:hypothetical protein
LRFSDGNQFALALFVLEAQRLDLGTCEGLAVFIVDMAGDDCGGNQPEGNVFEVLRLASSDL